MDEFTVVASSWQYSKNYVTGLAYFAVADYDEAPDIFTSVGGYFNFSFIVYENTHRLLTR